MTPGPLSLMLRLSRPTVGGEDLHVEPGEAVKPSPVSGDEGSRMGAGCSCDEKIVRAPGPAAPARIDEELCVCSCDLEVVRLDWDARQQRVDKRLAGRFVPAVREPHADEQLGCCNGSDRDVVLVVYHLVDRRRPALRCDEDRRVENQAFQSRSSGSSRVRSSASSSGQPVSAGCLRSRSLTTRPELTVAGAMFAIARPRRSTTNVSPSRSTWSSRSEKCLAASVAVSRLIPNQIIRLPGSTASTAAERTRREAGARQGQHRAASLFDLGDRPRPVARRTSPSA